MYAIISDSGKQFKVEIGQELDIDYREVPTGEDIRFERVLALSGSQGVAIGKPLVEGAHVTAEVLGPAKGEKIYVQKFRRRKTYHRRTGHRQIYTRVRISGIEGYSGDEAAATEAAATEEPQAVGAEH